MPTYIWQGTQAGKIVKGTIRAKHLNEAVEKLRSKGIGVFDIREKPGGFSLFGGVSYRDLSIVTRQFSTMLNAGIPVVETLFILSEQTSNKRLKNILIDIRTEVEQGKTLTSAMKKYSKIFGPLAISMIEVGETGGILAETLMKISEHYEKIYKLRSKIKSAMAYPVVIFFIAIIVVLILLIFLIPTFASLYESVGMKLPGPTRFVMNLSNFLRHNIIYILVGTGIFAFAFKRWKNTPGGKKIWDNFVLRVPIFGNLMKKNAIARFTRTLGVLVNSGVSILDALEISAQTAGNYVIETAILKARKSVGEGKSIAGPLRQSGVFPPLVTQLIEIGEKTGRLSDMLNKVSDFYEEEVDAATSALTSIIEPVMLVFIGGVVGGILLAMYLPIFNLASAIK